MPNMKKSLYLVSLIVVLLLSSCRRQTLEVDLEYVSNQKLASYHVRTPDPALQFPSVGQTLTIRWNLPEQMLPQTSIIWVKIRYRNHTQTSFGIKPKKVNGQWTYRLLNDDYFSTLGILSYQVTLYDKEIPIAVSEHQLWVEMIEF